ncbi:Xaa-Pro dipeptidase [Edwardsiella tarda]|uniref:Xaa-Pro dipeptidase n=1 Tax=Edwardsiella tarda TaxID=636 RepID=UPI0002FA08D5|nr:Xaa-Pro dipeptidase [Edwardsiella tarda]AKH90358.1 Xaa-Pro dipeptidase [Edwardsiella tarda]UCQ54135.1 Xaa-Pro dipeptidase [Edwardsiella tarda]
MDTLASLYTKHLALLQQRARTILERHNLDGLLIHSGEPLGRFLDDQDYPFKVNPHFKAWVPVTQVPHSWLWVDGVNKPKLWFYSPLDYWHSVSPLPQAFWTEQVEMTALRQVDEIGALLPSERHNVAYIGPNSERARALGISEAHLNPQAVLDFLHYHRAYKSEYEQACMREAQRIAVDGHQAALEAFRAGMSEFDINLAYLSATGQGDNDVPYDNIVALNQHAAVLHYTHLERRAPAEIQSFLIDAGAEFNGYAADLTRTYAAQAQSDFAALVADVNQAQQALIATLRCGVRYSDYNLQFHQRLAAILRQHHILTGISDEAAVAQGLTTPFMPHGLGHPLGLQVHDVAGFMQDEQGTHLAAPAQYPYLRCTRIMEPGMVMTIEPGLYFIDTLLAPWLEGEFGHHFDRRRIEALRPYGGIRIEDNVIFHANGVENMTRDLHLA